MGFKVWGIVIYFFGFPKFLIGITQFFKKGGF
ncbi:hypothetical protein N403_08445 [Helicobacter pylori FD430]|uniref:Uncharacterized protein n=1 Tax=Helicobacter pylori UM114 TaxID=1355531 RepID=T0F5A8_HELPX|nr:hypothetical protein N207_06860 [Helicobacter pylori UM114]EQL51286.1 hypothetical protein N403_08445 [Helicobacter pylori FD430]